MGKQSKGKNGVRHELENDAEYEGLSDDKTVKCPSTGEMISEKEYLRRFNNEWYYGSRQGKFKIMTTDQHKAEGRRRNNSNSRDMLSVAERTGTLTQLTDNEADFMKQASNEWEWQDVYKYAGPEEAKLVIFEQAKKDIKDGAIDLDVTLCRFVIKMMKLKTLNERKRKQGKKNEK